MNVQGFSMTWVTPLARRWRVVVGLGVVMVAVGSVVPWQPFDAVRTLAVLVAIGLAIAGGDEVAQAERHEVRWPSYVLAGIWLVTAVWALLWPGVTLWALAATVGVGLIIIGLTEVVFVLRYRRELPQWGVWWLDGVASVVIGVLALAWPEVNEPRPGDPARPPSSRVGMNARKCDRSSPCGDSWCHTSGAQMAVHGLSVTARGLQATGRAISGPGGRGRSRTARAA